MKNTMLLSALAAVSLPASAATLTLFSDDFEDSFDSTIQGGLVGTVGAAPAGFTDAVGNVGIINLSAVDAGRFGEIRAIPQALGLMGAVAGDSITMSFTLRSGAATIFDNGDRLAQIQFRYGRTAATIATDFDTTVANEGFITTPDTNGTFTITRIIPAANDTSGDDPSFVLPLLQIQNFNSNPATSPAGADPATDPFAYIDNFSISVDGPGVVPEPSSTLLVGLAGLALAARRRR